jgi:hypothetical protein
MFTLCVTITDVAPGMLDAVAADPLAHPLAVVDLAIGKSKIDESGSQSTARPKGAIAVSRHRHHGLV